MRFGLRFQVLHCGLFLMLACLLPDAAFAQYVRRDFFRNEQQRRARYALDDWISYTRTRSYSSVTVGDPYIYFATRDGGILRYHLFNNYWDYPFTTSNGLPDNHVEEVIYDYSTAFLWAITPNDMAIFNPASQEWIRRSENPDWIYSFPDSADVTNPTDPSKEKFFGRGELNNLPNFFANGDYTIQTGWILMDRYFQEFPFAGYLRDRYDRIWFVVDGFGVGRGDIFSQRADFYALGMPDIFPRALAYKGDDLWLGGIGIDVGRKNRPGIARWPYDEFGWEYFQARWISRLPSDNVSSIVVDGDSLWFGTDYGVSLYDSGRDRWQNYDETKALMSNLVEDLAIFGDYLYVATDFGMSRISLFTGLVEKIKDPRLINLPFRRLTVQEDTLWAATFRGIFRLVKSAPKWEFVPAKAAIQDLDVTAVDAYKNEVWFASSGGIMWLDTGSGNWESFPQVAFEVAGPYEDIKVNSAAAWVATPEGLLKYDRKLKYWKLFSTQDGLLNNHCRRLLLDGDYIWIVTDAGLTQFYWNSPSRID